MGNCCSCCCRSQKVHEWHPGDPKPSDSGDDRPKSNSGSKPKKKDVAFEVKSIDFHCEENREEHHTKEYEKKELIVRRGQKFKLSVTLDSTHFDPEHHNISLRFEVDNVEDKNLQYSAEMVPSLDNVTTWAVHVTAVNEKVVDLEVMTPPEAVVAMYRLMVVTEKDSKYEREYKEKDVIFVLFNAWCKDDVVFLKNDNERQEYVLEDDGLIWKRNNPTKGFPWVFGQFKPVSLDCALYLLFQLAQLDESRHLLGDPCLVSRALAGLVNMSGLFDTGVLVGNWSGNYEGGTNPSVWDGTVPILTKFMKNKQAVKYGQCWVFSGVLTTLCRAVGIPTRSVTNFSSAHDTDGSNTIDVYYDKNGDPIEGKNNDSVWNFHVWNECWFKRRDLGSLYDGWQVLDSTPQEYSRGGVLRPQMVCGPAPVTAIKEGDLAYGKDTAFVFAEVNGDRVVWEVDPEKDKMEVKYVQANCVGEAIYTKIVGANAGVDLVSTYKYSGEKEKEVMAKAVSHGTKCKYTDDLYGDQHKIDVDGRFKYVEIELGKDAPFKICVENSSNEVRTVKCKAQVRAALYTGNVEKTSCAEKESTVELRPKEEKEIDVFVAAEDYIDALHDANSLLKLHFRLDVEETGQVIMRSKDFAFTEPELDVKCPEKVDQHEKFTITVKFKNPLPRPMNDCVIHVEGGEVEEQTCDVGNIAPGSELVKNIDVTPEVGLMPRRQGSRLHVSLTSKQLATGALCYITVDRGV